MVTKEDIKNGYKSLKDVKISPLLPEEYFYIMIKKDFCYPYHPMFHLVVYSGNRASGNITISIPAAKKSTVIDQFMPFRNYRNGVVLSSRKIFNLKDVLKSKNKYFVDGYMTITVEGSLIVKNKPKEDWPKYDVSF